MTYGSPRIAAELKRKGHSISRRRVEKIILDKPH
ncbi:IS3 family transposase [Chryseobacterium defluvii]